ncbi:MAG: AAA family ATPase [Sandaracinus sp.]|nr:AAA family ATPase [Sandaracinus sp.]
MSVPVEVDTLLTRRLVVCVGPGGVGKTTTAAALALRAARLGRRALVLTVDPAKRLADALGLEGLDDRVQRVPNVGSTEGGSLDAAMLDTKASFDALITRVAEGEAREAILENRVYRAFSKTLARSHAYVAAERLYDVTHGGHYDLVVLDTPPTRSALEILDAPSKLAQFLDQDVLRFFLEERRGFAGTFASLAGLGGAAALELLGRLAGKTVVAELVAFFRLLAHLREGFQHRAEVTSALLRDPATGYVLVASSSPTSLDDARHLGAELAKKHAPASLVLFNKAFVAEPGEARPLDASRDVLDVPAALEPTARKLRALREDLVHDRERAFGLARRFVDDVAPGAHAVALGELERDLRTIEDLDRMLAVATRL